MKNTELQSLTVEELKQKLEAERESLTKLRFAHAISPIENPMKIRESKKLIARIATTLKNKEIQNNKA
ncbi:MAG: 50S ribosomal protein L29 [Cyclobacteriaceae bacterium]|nr:50S ribosomal protein L29 [Cyclobacteriaceae bacterium]